MLRKLATVLFVLAMAFPAMAQVNSRVSGTVTDSSGASVPGAKVELRLAAGASALYTAITSTDGLFAIPAVRPDSYDILVEAAGFQKSIQRGFLVQANRDVEIPAIRLEVGNVAETIEVSATAATVQTSNAEIATTITNTQLSKLPALNRSPLALLTTQAGVGSNGRSNTTINGMRVSFANVTVEGVNVQDNFIRSNGLDFLPNLLLLDQVGEVTLTTSNANPALGNGAAQIAFTVPSGNNSIRGRLLWTNRNNEFAANTWFNNRDGIRRPFLNQNQVGGSIGGAVIKDKLFYYGNYELFRLVQQGTANRTLLTADARQGIYTYRATDGTTRKINVLQVAGQTLNSTIQSRILSQLPPASAINNFRAGDSLETFLRNTAGYSFNIRNNRTRDNVAAKVDYVVNEKNSLTFTHLWNRDIVDRPDLANDFSLVPKVANDGAVRFYSGAWRWSPRANFTSEFRGGANITPAVFASTEDLSRPIIAPAIGSNPVNTFFPQGRYTDTYNYSSNSTWVKGRHTVQFGFQGQNIRVKAFNDAGIQPTYSLGMSAANQATLTAAQLPGIAGADLGGANALLATLAGFYASRSQTFNVIDRAAGFTPNSTSLRNLTQDLYSYYFQDTWKVSRRLTLNLGVRYDYFTVPDEKNGLSAMPRLINGNEIVSLLDPNNFLDFASKKDGRPWFRPDRNNFAPNFGFAYQLGNSGKTVVRGGYSFNYVNDELIRSLDNNVISTNAVFSQGRNEPNLVGRVVDSLPNLAPPTFTVPWAFSGSRALSLANAFGMPAQDLEVPYVQQFNLGIQHEVKGWIADIRFVGNRSTNLFRAFDFNQIDIFDNGFLADFIKARNNGNICRSAGRGFNPSCTGLPGTQPLTVFPLIGSGGGALTNGNVLNLIDQGAVAELGSFYYTNGIQGNVQFFRNPNALATNMMTNYSYASYNALQIDFTRRFANGLQAQFNYVWSKNLSDSAGDGQARFEAFLDFNNAALERSPTPFDQRHVFKANGYYELPYGKGRRWGSSVPAVVDYILGGWSVSGILTYASGSPFSIASGRGTFNRGGRSGDNGADIVGALGTGAVRLVVTGTGPRIIDPIAINAADGRGVNVDGQPNFATQVFGNPGPGRIGALQRRSFYGPNGGNLDSSIQKTFRFTEKLNLEFRGEAFNVFNNPVFFAGDQNINSTTFGRLTGTVYARRLMQFGIFINWR
jgi:hypothetical protein